MVKPLLRLANVVVIALFLTISTGIVLALYGEIGRLTTPFAWLKKKSGLEPDRSVTLKSVAF